MKDNIQIRSAKEEDSPQVAELMGELGYPTATQAIRKKIMDFARRESDIVLVAESDAEIIGVLSFHLTPLFHAPGNLGRITSLVITKRLRGKGIGRMLIEEAEVWAWAHDCARIEVTSGDHRPGAHEFYEKNGYKFDERRFIKRKPNQGTESSTVAEI